MGMCRINRVESARKDQGKCERCGVAIAAGTGYRWWKGRYTSRHVRCMRASCTPQSWELETNPLRAENMQGESIFSDARTVDDAGSAASYLRDAIAAAESIRDQLDGRISNLSGTAFELDNRAYALETSRDAFDDWLISAEEVANALEQLDSDAPSMSDYDAADYDGSDDDAMSAYDTACEEYEQALGDARADLEDWPELDLGQ